MSEQEINLRPDILKLQERGVDVSIENAYLVVHNVPYLNDKKELHQGKLFSPLNSIGTTPEHTMYFTGDRPCKIDGKYIPAIFHSHKVKNVSGELVSKMMFSYKENGGYSDNYEKVMTYTSVISGPANTMVKDISPQPKNPEGPIKVSPSPFVYTDTASSRAGISHLAEKLTMDKVVIIGMGGTGSFLLDLLVKTPIQEIHLYDSDVFEQHNAFRSPGAPPFSIFEKKLSKVDYYFDIYKSIHKGIVPHSINITKKNIDEILDADFVFLCVDEGGDRRSILKSLMDNDIPAIDTGLGVSLDNDQLDGSVHTVLLSNNDDEDILDFVPKKTKNDEDLYEQNIQIADLNALNAVLAVIQWKKYYEYFADRDNNRVIGYALFSNKIISRKKNDEK